MLLVSLWLLAMFMGKSSDRCHVPELLQDYTELLIGGREQCSNNKKVDLTNEERKA